MKIFFNLLLDMLKLSSYILVPLFGLLLVFLLLCSVWAFYFKVKKNKTIPRSGQVVQHKTNMLYQLFVQVPRRYVLDLIERDPDYFYPRGIHMFCGEQGCGKTIGCVEMMLRYQKQYPKSKVISNFAVSSEDDELKQWQQLLTYTNGHKGVIVGIDEIQNWFMSGLNKLPEGMLEVATQNRKNNRILCCTAQVFTRVNKGLREQVSMVYNPHTFLGCFTIVIKRKPIFDSEGNVKKLKYKGMYSFVHTDELRAAYDTYKVIHTLAQEGFKEILPAPVTNVYVMDSKKAK